MSYTCLGKDMLSPFLLATGFGLCTYTSKVQAKGVRCFEQEDIREVDKTFSLKKNSTPHQGFSSWSKRKLCLTAFSLYFYSHWQRHAFSTSVAPLSGITNSTSLFDISANNGLKNHPLLFKTASWNNSPSSAMWQPAANGKSVFNHMKLTL